MTIKFDQFPLDKIGRGMGLVGAIFSDSENAYAFVFPDYQEDSPELWEVAATHEEWKTLIRQTDLIEMPVRVKDQDGKLYKAILRKCQRRIDQTVSWGVFKRDGYCCRYCGRDGLPLTVDHLILWEEGGPSTEDNLLTACRKCNKARGNTQYADWLRHPFYQRVSANLTEDQRIENRAVGERLHEVERVYQQRSR
jgi:hypothetical protein